MRTMANDLREALTMTRRALDEESIDAARLVVSLRAPLLERAAAAKRAGERWGSTEAELAEQLMEVDLQLVQVLWTPHQEAFAWLAARDESQVADMPHLRQLAGK